MNSRFLALLLFSLGLAAQAPAASTGPAIKVVIQSDSQSKDTPPIDAAPIAKAFDAFTHAAGFTALAQDGDGWVLGVQMSSLSDAPGRLAIARATIRLAPVVKGQVVKKEVKDCLVIGEAKTGEALSAALAYSLTRRACDLLSDAKVVPASLRSGIDPNNPDDVPGVVDPVRFFPSTSIQIDRMPYDKPHPVDTLGHRVQGKVTLDLDINPEGRLIAAVAREGQVLLFQYAIEWALGVQCKPLMFEGSPVEGRVHMDINYHVRF